MSFDGEYLSLIKVSELISALALTVSEILTIQICDPEILGQDRKVQHTQRCHCSGVIRWQMSNSIGVVSCIFALARNAFQYIFELQNYFKPGLDKDTPGNYRPISNLNNISKMLERLILKRIQSQTTSSSNFNPFQSAYRRYFSTEFALLFALDNTYHAIDAGSSTVLVSLDLSAAFDTIEHSVLLNRLQNSFGFTGLALAWFQSYLSDRRQFVRIVAQNLQRLHAVRVFHRGLCLVQCFSLYISHLLLTLSAHSVYCSSSILTTHNFTSLFLKTITFLP